jgi:uncharacterized protein (UPF0335 family)
MNNVTFKTHNLEVSMTGEELAQITDRINFERNKKLKVSNEVIDVSNLKSTIEKLERLESLKESYIEDAKEGYAEAAALGFCVKTLRHVLKLRKKHKDKIAEEDNLIELYRGALDI